jgi:hypothetical protein
MSDELVEDEFANRPDDDELAFLRYEKLFRISLEKRASSTPRGKQRRILELLQSFHADLY